MIPDRAFIEDFFALEFPRLMPVRIESVHEQCKLRCCQSPNKFAGDAGEDFRLGPGKFLGGAASSVDFDAVIHDILSSLSRPCLRGRRIETCFFVG